MNGSILQHNSIESLIPVRITSPLSSDSNSRTSSALILTNYVPENANKSTSVTDFGGLQNNIQRIIIDDSYYEDIIPQQTENVAKRKKN